MNSMKKHLCFEPKDISRLGIRIRHMLAKVISSKNQMLIDFKLAARDISELIEFVIDRIVKCLYRRVRSERSLT